MREAIHVLMPSSNPLSSAMEVGFCSVQHMLFGAPSVPMFLGKDSVKGHAIYLKPIRHQLRELDRIFGKVGDQ
jgi:hypothetical protein